MSDESCNFSLEQWNFLAVFDAVGEPIALDIAGAISPLLPTQLLKVLQQAENLSILKKTGEDVYCLMEDLPDRVRGKLASINTKERIADLLDRLTTLNLLEQLAPEAHMNLVIRSGRGQGGQIEINLAHKFLKNCQYEKALVCYGNGIKGLHSKLNQVEGASLFVECVLLFSDLSFALGKEFITAYQFLETAGPVAERTGDLRAKSLIDLHIGRLLYIGNRRHEAVALMQKAEAVIRELGDEDIQVRAAEFLALYYYMQGRFPEAVEYFEIGFRTFEDRQGRYMANPSAPIFYGFCTAYMGQFHKAIGNLDSAWRKARQEKNNAYASILRASLGMILLLTKKEKEGVAHVKRSLVQAKECGNVLGLYFSQGYVAYHQYLKGDYKEACRLLKEVSETAKKSNIIYHFSSPWLLEMIFHMGKEGYPFLTENEIEKGVDRILNDPSIHLRGVLLRLIAQLIADAKEKPERKQIYLELLKKNGFVKSSAAVDMQEISKTILEKSESYLTSTGDPVQLGKTRIEMAQLALKSGNRNQAGILARKARKGLSGFWEEYFPDGIRVLLDEHSVTEDAADAPYIDNETLLQATADLAPSLTLNSFFKNMVTTMNRFFRAERGGLFWADDQHVESLSLKESRHFSLLDIRGEDFSPNMEIVRKCFHSGKPIILHSRRSGRKLKNYNVFALLCIPLQLEDKVSGVLYFDNSYLDDCFDFFDESVLVRLAARLNIFIRHIQQIELLIADAKASSVVALNSGPEPAKHGILMKSRIMKGILENADQIAASDSGVLIQGETGVGKELMAEYLHLLSPRRDKPFIIIDPTTIPEHLVESELFGYEKGAFTGADKQKRGRIELAHKGTLFIDEIGEMPKAIQMKLLRVLQEKTFVRIGGNRPIHSDFRLVAATNRNLAEEVAKGNFREDLFYRVSIIPVRVPPLRQRKEDILLLAQHFLKRFKMKYLHPGLMLTREDEYALLHYEWPGNVRELINVIERAVILSRGDHLELSLKSPSEIIDAGPFDDIPSMDDLQRRYIEHILKKTNGRISGKGGAAEILKMKRSTLYSRMDKLGIPR
ncbi:MAG: sigma 54-interacting transcriptional regulator [Pseudomonadota bacterium]